MKESAVPSGKNRTRQKLEALLRQYDIRPKHQHGQNFLADGEVMRRELQHAEINKDDIVLEIGPGIGLLTEALAQRAGRVVAIEKDDQFAGRLNDLAARFTNLEIHWGDAMELPFPPFTKAVANLPFKMALPLTFKLLERRFERAVLIYQARQAQRLCAKVGEPGYSRIGITASQKGRLEYLETIPRRAFRPQPKVDSALVSIERTKPRFSLPPEDFFRPLLEALFAQRESKIAQALYQEPPAGLDQASLSRALAQLSGKIKHKTIYRTTPKQFSELAWKLWQAKNSSS